MGSNSLGTIGHLPQLHDKREMYEQDPKLDKSKRPTSRNLSQDEHSHVHKTPYDQGWLGSCTANAIGSALHFGENLKGVQSYEPSRRFLYWAERLA